MSASLRLGQDQVWEVDGGFVRIVRLERLLVGFKRLEDLTTRDGTHLELTKKEFCRMIKGGRLLEAGELPDLQPGSEWSK
jgi:hypothetical protein